jgi:very-short-patch-repair endonuclease
MASTFARQLRQTPTEAELRLWSRLRGKQLDGFRFRRQHPIGPYVADFFCPEAKLIVEVDGGQHAEDSPTRTDWIESQGYRVVRLWNNEALANTDGALTVILDALHAQMFPPGVSAQHSDGGTIPPTRRPKRRRPPPQGGRRLEEGAGE